MTSASLKALGERVKKARLDRGLTQKQLAQAVGRSKQLVCAWEQGRAEILATSLALIGKSLSVDVTWLLYGKAAGTALPALPSGAIVPLLSAPQLMMLASGRFPLAKVDQRTFVHGPVSDRTFATFAQDDGMGPYISTGDIVTVDPTRALQSGDVGLIIVFAEGEKKLKAPVPLFREVRFRTLVGAEGRFQLVPAQNIFPSVDIENSGEAIILGRVVGVQKFQT